VWVKQAGGARSGDDGIAITILPSGSAVVTGMFDGSATFGPGELNEKTLIAEGTTGVFVAKYTADGDLVWAKGAGGESYNGGRAIASLPDGSVLVAGNVGPNAVFGKDEEEETVLGAATFIAKYNSTGRLVWVKGVYGWLSEGTGVAVSSDGLPVLVGSFLDAVTLGAGEVNETELISNWEDIFVAGYNPDGALAWAVSAGGEGDDEVHCVGSLGDGVVVVSGTYDEDIIFGRDEMNETILVATNTPSTRNVFIAGYSRDGTLAWAKKVGGRTVNGLAVLPQGSFLITGSYRGATVFGSGEPNETRLVADYGIYLALYNPDGTLEWVRSTGGDFDNSRNLISVSSEGSFVVAGNLAGTDTFGEGEDNEITFFTVDTGNFIARYNQDGSLLWAKNLGTTNGIHAIALLADGSSLITGNFGGTVTFGAGEPNETTLNGQYYDIYLMKIAP
jgi:hypothetical protein